MAAPALAEIDVERVPLPAEPQSQASALRTAAGDPIDPQEINVQLEGATAQETIAWALETFHPRLRFAASFQKTSSVTVDIVSKLVDDPNFFYLDTDLLFEETYITRDALAKAASGEPS